MATQSAEAGPRTAYRVTADSVEACNCDHGCNCQFAGYPNDGFCEFLIGYRVTAGQFGDVDLEGVRAVVAMKYPDAIHQGDGHVVLFVDERASEEQAEAFTAIVSGRAGGMPWEGLAGTMARFEGPIRERIEFEYDGPRSRVEVEGVAELQASPLRNPVSGEEKEVHITYPKGGFFWDDGYMATTEVMRVDYGDLQLEWPGRYAAAAEVSWTNQS